MGRRVMHLAAGLLTLAACWSRTTTAQSPASQPVTAQSPASQPVMQASPAPARPPHDVEQPPTEDDEASTPPQGKIVVVSGAPCGGLFPIVWFDHGSALIKPKNVQTLDSLATGIRCDTDTPSGLTVEFFVVGHSAPGESKPGPLSVARAKVVAKELEARGVPPGVLVVSGEGAIKPAGDTRTENGRRYNRRVEIIRVVHGSD